MSKLLTLTQAESIANGVIAKVKNKGYLVESDLGALALKDEVAKSDLASALATEITSATTNISTLQGEDTAKSVRTISAEEVAKIVAEAPESLDTLKEIADWISDHADDAAAMNSAITALQSKTVLGTDASGDEYATVKAYVEAIQTALNTSIDTKVDKVTGKGLSTNDYTDAEKTKLADIEIATAAEVEDVIDSLDNL